MKKTRRPYIQSDNRAKAVTKYAGKSEMPAEWLGHIQINGSEIWWDGRIVGRVTRGGVTYRATSPGGKTVRKFSRVAAIQHLLDSRTSEVT